MKKLVFIFLSFIVFPFAKGQDMFIVLLAGQSNMSGKGIYSQLSPQDTVTYSNVLSLNKDSVWVRARHPLHWDVGDAAVGMGIKFGHELALKIGGNIRIGLVPCAAGGTSIDKWLSNAYFGNTGNFYLYTNLIKRAKRAAQSGQIIGLIWHQGESHATMALYPTYQNKLKTLFTKIRTDLQITDLPIVAGELGTYLATNTSFSRWDSINAQINGLKKVLVNYDVASSFGLSPNSDNLHFSSASQILFGKRYADLLYPIASGTTAVKNPTMSPVKVAVRVNSIHVSSNTTSAATITIYNLLGKSVKTVNTSEQETDIQTETLKGIYIISIHHRDGIFSEKKVL